MSKRLTTSEVAFAIAVETTQAMHTAKAMIRDAEVAALAKHTAEKHTQCRQCQAALENFLIEYPDCKPEAIDEKHREVWEACPACRSEYVEVLNSEYCEHGNPAHLCTDCTDAWADANAPEAHHELDIHCYNGDDTHWQNGGA